MTTEIKEQPKEIKGVRPNTDKSKKVDTKFLRDRDKEMVRGKFIFHECSGGVLEFVFRAYKEDPLERYSLIDGQIYSIPLGVARHLNKNCYTPRYEYIKGDKDTVAVSSFQGGNMVKVTHKERRCSFQSLEFIDSEDLTPDTLVLQANFTM